MNKKLNAGIETMFLMSDVENQIISSKFVKEIANLGGDIENLLLNTVKMLKNKYLWNLLSIYLYFFSLVNTKLNAQEMMILKLQYGDRNRTVRRKL